MLISYIQSIMMIILEVICCKIFFESFAEKRSKNNYRNYSIILGIVVCEYVIASLFYDKFILKQILAIVAVAVFMCFYFKIHFGKAIILSLLFQALLLSVDYFTLWLNVSLFDSIAEISRLHFVGGSLITVLGKIILFLVVLLIRKKVGGESSDVLRSTDWLRFIFFPVFTIVSYLVIVIISEKLSEHPQWLFAIVLLAITGIGLIGTANHPNMHMTSDELMESKKSARTIVLLEGCIILGCVLLDADMVYVSYMAIAVILCAALLCIAKIFKQEVKE